MVGFILLMIYIITGLAMSNRIFAEEPVYIRLWAGGLLGILGLMWSVVPFAFFAGFSVLSHILGLLLMGIIYLCIRIIYNKEASLKYKSDGIDYLLYSVVVPISAITIYLLNGHVLAPGRGDGGLFSGQSTYGDLCLHLGIITSISTQGKFPPEYSIYPGQLLSYPFLTDSLSSSLYLFGMPLRWAVLIPSYLMVILLAAGFFIFAHEILKDKYAATLASVLFFFNGGLGFIYFMDDIKKNPENFTRIFTAWYNTPTNYNEHSIRWSNIICDMIIPQRTTLAGWLFILFALWLLYRAISSNKTGYFIMAGIVAGLMPMIHTHSFLAFGIIAIAWFAAYFFQCGECGADSGMDSFNNSPVPGSQPACLINNPLTGASKPAHLINNPLTGTSKPAYLINYPFTGSSKPACLMKWAYVLVILLLVFVPGFVKDYLVYIAILTAFIVIYNGIFYIINSQNRAGIFKYCINWVYFGIPVILLAVPQLFTWTFRQVSGNNFTRWQSGWSVIEADIGIWFWIKNVGIVFILLIPALLAAGRRVVQAYSGALAVFAISSLILFQPNNYDNNKLFYIWFIFSVIVVSQYALSIYRRLEGIYGRSLLAAIILIFCTISGVLTIGREAKSNGQYMLFDNNAVLAAEFVKANTPADALFISGDQHVNPIAALSGRNVFSGANIYLYFHGIDKNERDEATAKMFTEPDAFKKLAEQYGVDYVYYSNYEKTKFNVEPEFFKQNYPTIFHKGDIYIFAISKRAKASSSANASWLQKLY